MVMKARGRTEPPVPVDCLWSKTSNARTVRLVRLLYTQDCVKKRMLRTAKRGGVQIPTLGRFFMER